MSIQQSKGYRTSFDAHEYALPFANSFPFDADERVFLRESFKSLMVGGAAVGVLFFGIGIVLVPLALLFARRVLERNLSPVYGLCGGMCFTALDCHRVGIPMSRLFGRIERPSPGSSLHRYLWKRQLDSWASDGLRFVVWLTCLNCVPTRRPFNGGAKWLNRRSQREWRNLKAFLDAGQPMPIGLVRERRSLYDNHQVVALGYDEMDDTHGRIEIYDPNCPGNESTIDLQFQVDMLDGRESCGGSVPLRGFFVERYRARLPDWVSEESLEK